MYPSEVDIDLGGLHAVNGFHYLPRTNGGNGMLKGYEIYVSRSKDEFGDPVATGEFGKGADLKTVSFDTRWGEFKNDQSFGGKVLFESPGQTGKSVKQLMELDIKGMKELRLVLLDLGDGSENDHGDWIEARLLRKGSE